VKPYSNGKQFFCENTIVDPFDVESIRINRTVSSSKNLLPIIRRRREDEERRTRVHVAISDEWYVTKEGEDATREFIKAPPVKSTMPENVKSPDIKYDAKKIFIVHGHDKVSKLELARILEDLGLKPIILHEQANGGKTLIEKFEKNVENIGYAFILLTPDDFCNEDKKYRARQNVILELGYFIGKLGRDRVCYIYKEGVELPSDIHGVVYSSFTKEVRECHVDIIRELKHAGYKLTL
jgi:predicted nucleotide-binding protein